MKKTLLVHAARTVMLFALGLAGSAAAAQDCGTLFDETQVLDFYITMDPADWDALRTSCPGGFCGSRPHFYWNATFQCESGPQIQVGIRRKNGTAEPSETDPQKPALKIDINEFVPGQTFSGKVKLNLENGGSSSGPPDGGGGGGGNDNGFREGFAWLLYGDAGIVASRVAWVNVWVNGDLTGLYNHVEQIDKSFLVDHGIDEGGWLFKGPGNDQRTRETEANPFAFNWYPFDHVNPEETQPADWHDQTESRVNMPQLFALAAVTNFVANKDAVVFKNNNYWYYDWTVFPDGQQPRLYFGWDLDTVMKSQDDDEPILGTPTNNGHMAQGLLRDGPVFQAQYYQVYNDLMTGPLSLSATIARADALELIIGPHWDADPHQTTGSAAGLFQDIRNFLTARTTFVLAALGDCPNGTCEATESPCTCPADCGSPAVSESVCTDGIDEDCDGPFDCGDGDCGTDPACTVVPPPNPIVVNEIVANSPGSPDVEFVELYNNGTTTQDLTGWYLLDDDNSHDKCFLDGTLDAGDYRVVAGFISDFSARYPEAIANLNANPFDSTVSGQGFSLGDDGDHVRLFRPTATGDEFVDGYTFGPQSEEIPFGYLPEGTDAPEYVTFPTPGSSNDVTNAFSPICINEFLTTSLIGGIDDWIELYNRSASAVDIGGWYLSDSAADPTKFAFPGGTSIPAGGFLTIDETQLGFSLSSTGSEVIVLTHADGVTGQDYFDYDIQFPDVTRGRFPDGTPNWLFLASPSRGQSNACRVEGLEFSSRDDLDWNPHGTAATYDVVKGDLIALRSTGGDYSIAVSGCAGDNIGTSLNDIQTPGVGEALFYVVRAVDSDCGAGSYDASSISQIAGRDAGIGGAGPACP